MSTPHRPSALLDHEREYIEKLFVTQEQLRVAQEKLRVAQKELEETKAILGDLLQEKKLKVYAVTYLDGSNVDDVGGITEAVCFLSLQAAKERVAASATAILPWRESYSPIDSEDWVKQPRRWTADVAEPVIDGDTSYEIAEYEIG